MRNIVFSLNKRDEFSSTYIVYGTWWKHTSCNKSASCSNAVPTTCQPDVFALPVSRLLTSCHSLLSSTNMLQVVPTTCYRPATQQFVNNLWVTNLSKITALLQLVDKLATNLLRTHLVDKLWDFDVRKRRLKVSIYFSRKKTRRKMILFYELRRKLLVNYRSMIL